MSVYVVGNCKENYTNSTYVRGYVNAQKASQVSLWTTRYRGHFCRVIKLSGSAFITVHKEVPRSQINTYLTASKPKFKTVIQLKCSSLLRKIRDDLCCFAGHNRPDECYLKIELEPNRWYIMYSYVHIGK